MLRKVDITPIVSGHIQTLQDHRTGKLSWLDITLFFVLPLAVAGLAIWEKIRLRPIAVTGLLTASSLFVALLLNLLVMVLAYLRATQGDAGDQTLRQRKVLLRQVAANLSFSILVALGLVTTALAALFNLNGEQDVKIGPVPTFLLITGASILVLNLLMVLRRMYILIQNEFDLHKFQKTP